MNTKSYASSRSWASQWYERMIALYPAGYLEKHREELLQNFEDLEKDIGSRRFFWAFMFGDFIKSITQQYMNYFKHHRWIQVAVVIVIVIGALGAWQVLALQKAHSSFANYAAFRGCATVTSQSDTSGTCTLANGASITLVKFDNRWFLQGDLPVCMIGIGSFCLVHQP